MADWIEKLPTAQKRCGSHKKYVHVDKKFVYKGPYTGSKPDQLQLERACRIPMLIDYLQKCLNIPEKHRTALPPIDKIDLNGSVYLKYHNVGSSPNNKDIDIVTTKLDQNIPVLKRETYVYRVSELEKMRELSSEEMSIILQHLYLIYLLNVGDAGTHNMLACKNSSQLFVGVDYEEVRGVEQSKRAETDVFACLFKTSASKLQKKIYGPHLAKIQQIDLSELDVDKFQSLGGEIDSFKKNIDVFAKSYLTY